MTEITASLTAQTSTALAAAGPAAASAGQGFASVFSGLFGSAQAQPGTAVGALTDPAAASPPALAIQLTAALSRLAGQGALAQTEGEAEILDGVTAHPSAKRAAKTGAEDTQQETAPTAPAFAIPMVQAEAAAVFGGSDVARASAAPDFAFQAQAGTTSGDATSPAGQAIPVPKPANAAPASITAVVSPDVPSPPEAAGTSRAQGAKGPAPIADEAARTPNAPATPNAHSAKAAIVVDAAVTRLIGEIATETPKLEAPSALTPPSVSGTPADAGGDDPSEGGPQPDAKPAASAAVAPAAKTDDGDMPAPDHADPQPSAARADTAAPPNAERATAAASQIQTAAAPATPAAQNPQAAAGATAAAAVQVATEIAGHAGARRTRFEVRLDPGELGRVDVRLDIAHDGRLATRLIVERPETLDMLRNDARELTRSLEQAGFQLGQGGLAFQLKDGRQGDWRDDRSASSNERAPVVPDQPAPANEIYRRAARSGGVDVTV